MDRLGSPKAGNAKCAFGRVDAAGRGGAGWRARLRLDPLMLVLMLMLMLTVSAPAMAAPPDNLLPQKSRYTTISLADCKLLQKHPDGNAWSCEGLPGFPVYLAEGDQRTFMSFGAGAEKRRAATQTLGAFNSVFRDKRNRATIEWRYVRREGRDRPYAAIVRYVTTRDGARGQVIVVTRISDGEACHLGYIDALANPSAIALARSLADERARAFDCKSGAPAVIGATGRSPI